MKNLPNKFSQDAIQKEGLQTLAIIKTCEEMGELIQALSKYTRGKWKINKVSEEIADVEIMLEHLKGIFSISAQVFDEKLVKTRRIAEKIRRYGKKSV